MIKNIFRFSLLEHINVFIAYRYNLPYILLSILRFSLTNPTISDSLSLVNAAERTTVFQP